MGVKTQADGGRTLDSKAQAQQSGQEQKQGQMSYPELVVAVATIIQDWAFWRWLGRRSHFIPMDAYWSLTVRATGQISDVGDVAIAAAYQRLQGRLANDAVVSSDRHQWRSFMDYVRRECLTRNVLKGEGGR